MEQSVLQDRQNTPTHMGIFSNFHPRFTMATNLLKLANLKDKGSMLVSKDPTINGSLITTQYDDLPFTKENKFKITHKLYISKTIPRGHYKLHVQVE